MKYLKMAAIWAVLAVMTTNVLSAQEDVKSYFKETDPVLVKFKQNVDEFLPKIQGLREKKDLVGLKQTADEFAKRWAGLVTELDKTTPPKDASEYHQALKRLLELQRESNIIMSETLGHRIAVILEARKMKKDGSSEEDVQAFIDKNRLDKDQIVARTSAVKSETQQADAKMKSERKRLVALIGEESEK